MDTSANNNHWSSFCDIIHFQLCGYKILLFLPKDFPFCFAYKIQATRTARNFFAHVSQQKTSKPQTWYCVAVCAQAEQDLLDNLVQRQFENSAIDFGLCVPKFSDGAGLARVQCNLWSFSVISMVFAEHRRNARAIFEPLPGSVS